MGTKTPQHLDHPFPALYNADSELLILGSFPSVQSRKQNFFYGHPQNRFWKLLPILYGEESLQTVEEKTAFCLRHHIALWDVIASCEIVGSSDASIQNAVANDLQPILAHSHIQRIFTNGKTADKLYRQYIYPNTQLESICLPSTSPANAAWTMDRLQSAWNILL